MSVRWVDRMEKREREREKGERRAAGTLPTSRHPVDPIFFKRSAHSSQPDSLTIIKRKSLYFALSFHPCTYFLPSPVSSPHLSLLPFFLPSLRPHCAFAPLCSSRFLASRSFSSSPPPLPILFPVRCRLFYYPITFICSAKGTIAGDAADEQANGKENGEGGARVSAKMGKGRKSWPLN